MEKFNKYALPLITILVIYLPTLAYIPVYVYLALIPIVGYLKFDVIKNWWKKDKKFNSNMIAVASILGFAFINRLLHFNISNPLSIHSDVFLLPVILMAALVFADKKYYTLFIACVFIEILFGVVQFSIGESSFFTGLLNYYAFTDYNLFYNCKVFGLSSNSSNFALKIFAAIVLVRGLKLQFKWLLLIKLVLYFGIIISFNRAAIIGCVVYESLYFFILLLKKKHTIQQSVVLAAVVLVLSVNYKEVKRQFLRQSVGVQSVISFSEDGRTLSEKEKLELIQLNTDNDQYLARILELYANSDDSLAKMELLNQYLKNTQQKRIHSGRESIWKRYTDFSLANFLFGNGSKRLIDPYAYHAHSIYLHILSMHGIIIALLFMYFIIKNINLKNAPVIIAMLVIGIFQSVIFWGISALDIVFYSILLSPFNIFED